MNGEVVGFWSSLTTREAEFCEHAIAEFRNVGWAGALIGRIFELGGLSTATMSYLFELRFAYELHRAGVVAEYEVPGEAGTTIDFGFTCENTRFMVELLRLEETAAARAATTIDETGVLPHISRYLSSAAEDSRQSEEGETLKAVERICQKLEHGGRPSKFPIAGEAIHVLLVDMRNFLSGASDRHDFRHIAYGAGAVHALFRRFWNRQPISGVFSPETAVRGSVEARERLHILGLVNDTGFGDGSFSEGTHLFGNPALVPTKEVSRRLYDAWPLTKSTGES